MIKAFCQAHNVVQIAYDPYQLHDMMTRLMRQNVAWCNPFSQGGDRLVADSQLYQLIVQRLLATREDIFSDYTREACEKALEKYFSIVRMVDITDSERTLYLLRNKQV